MYESIAYWLCILELNKYNVRTEKIDREQVIFPEDIDEEDRYYVGISDEEYEAIIYHDRDLTEEDIVHELLHLRFPSLDEDMINKLTDVFLGYYKLDT